MPSMAEVEEFMENESTHITNKLPNGSSLPYTVIA
jgi:hypothetical protein